VPHDIFNYILNDSVEAFRLYLIHTTPNLYKLVYEKEKQVTQSSYSSYGISNTTEPEKESIWEGYTPFHMLVALGDVKKLSIFCDYTKNQYTITLRDEEEKMNMLKYIFDAPDLNGHTPFHTYVELNQTSIAPIYNWIFKEFGEHTINFKVRTFHNQIKERPDRNAIHLCVKQNNNVQMLYFLLYQLQIDFRVRDANGFLPIHIAAEYNNIPAIEAFLETDSSLLNAETEQGDTIIHTLASKNAVEALTRLQKYQPNYQSRNKKSFTPLHFAAENLAYDAMVFLITQCHVRIDLLTMDLNYTSMHCYIDRFCKLKEITAKHKEQLVNCFKLFIQKGVDPKEKYSSTQSLMDLAKIKLDPIYYKLLHEAYDEFMPYIHGSRLRNEMLSIDLVNLTPEQSAILYYKMRELTLIFAAQTFPSQQQCFQLEAIFKRIETKHPALARTAAILSSYGLNDQTNHPYKWIQSTDQQMIADESKSSVPFSFGSSSEKRC